MTFNLNITGNREQAKAGPKVAILVEDCCNTSNIIFLKSTDDAMLDQLQKMSGITHKVFSDQESITTDVGRLIFRKDDKRTTTNSVKEVPVISYNDMAFIPMCNSIVFRAGDSPIWNRNQTCLPMSWRLFDNTIVKPGKSYTLQTIPTLSSAIDFDVRQNQPNFIKMWERRRDQAVLVDSVTKAYAKAYGYDDDAISRLDQDTYSDEIMQIINEELAKQAGKKCSEKPANKEVYSENKTFVDSAAKAEEESKIWQMPRYAGGQLSKSSLQQYPDNPNVLNHMLDEYFIQAYLDSKSAFSHDTEHFVYKSDGSLYSLDGVPYFERTISQSDVDAMRKAAMAKDTHVYTDGALNISSEYQGFNVTDAFYRFLLSQDSWNSFASGKFELSMAKILRNPEEA